MKAVIYARVSTDEQTEQNQVDVLEKWAATRGFEVSEVYREQATAWKDGHQKELARLILDAQRGQFQYVMVWALDRLSREGALKILELVNKFNRWNVKILSYQEPWTEAPGELGEVLYALVGWVARMESQRRSERTKAGMDRAKAAGKHVGRPRKNIKPITLKDIYNISPDVLGTRFYVVKFDPVMHPTWVKFGITRNLRQRFTAYLLLHPMCQLVGSWRSTTRWEKSAIEFVISKLGAIPVRNSKEFYEIEDSSRLIDILNAWFLAQYVNTKEGGGIVQASFRV